MKPEDLPIQPASPYTTLAQIYDQMMIHVNYPQWARYVKKVAKSEGFTKSSRLLDIGCGSGRFLQEMKKLRWKGDGCEPSGEMLVLAKKRLPKFNLVQDGFPDLQTIPANQYQLFTCLYDSINYIFPPETLKKSLATAYQKLTSPGLFVFDVVSEAHCKYYFQNYTDSEILSGGLAYTRKSYYDKSKKVQYNWVRIHTNEGIFEEEHRQRIYDIRDLREMIVRSTGFSVKMYEEFTFDPVNRKSGRIHFVLKKL